MMQILVFDDDAAIGRLVVRAAQSIGNATAVTEPEQFKQSLQANPPDVIVLDLQLGGTDAVEQLRYLAEQHYSGSLILMSGFDARVLATTHTLADGMGLRVAARLAKPIRISELEQALRHLQSSAEEGPSIDRLLKAIADDELHLDFQPVVTRHPKTLKKLEALVRWDHPAMGRIPPDKFLPLAESNSAAIDALTDWVIGAALEAWQVLAEFGIKVPIAVNVSTRNLHDLTLPDRLAERVRAANVPAGDICLEVTESATFQDVPKTMDVLTRFRLKGFRLSIDDFGTGYSSLKVLRQMPFTEIKIDRAFVSDMTTSRDSRAIVKSIIDLAANMGMDCVAEGVEKEETAVLLESLNVGALQGYLISRPIPVEAIPVWLAGWAGRGPGALRSGPDAPRDVLDSDPPRASVKLTPRQAEVMQLLTEGCSVKMIARRLGLGPGTVKIHISHAYSALGVQNRIDAVMRAGFRPREQTMREGQLEGACA